MIEWPSDQIQTQNFVNAKQKLGTKYTVRGLSEDEEKLNITSKARALNCQQAGSPFTATSTTGSEITDNTQLT
jgi:hypothetical protein